MSKYKTITSDEIFPVIAVLVVCSFCLFLLYSALQISSTFLIQSTQCVLQLLVAEGVVWSILGFFPCFRSRSDQLWVWCVVWLSSCWHCGGPMIYEREKMVQNFGLLSSTGRSRFLAQSDKMLRADFTDWMLIGWSSTNLAKTIEFLKMKKVR